MTEYKTVEDAMAAVKASAKREKKAQQERRRKGADVRRIATLEAGDCPRQGDVYFCYLGREFPAGFVPGEEWLPGGHDDAQRLQLAPGTSIGSQHVVHGDVKIYRPGGGEWALVRKLVGSVDIGVGGEEAELLEDRQEFVSHVIDTETERLLVNHPNHPAFDLPPGIYAAWGQVTLAEGQERIRRAAD